jgi:hypothetical protein
MAVSSFDFGEPHNPNARGKVESSHLLVEKFEKLISLGELAGEVPTIETLNLFAERICDAYNWTSTARPERSRKFVFAPATALCEWRRPKFLADAFKARELSVVVNSDVTISVDAVRWQLPQSRRISASAPARKKLRTRSSIWQHRAFQKD